MIYIIRHGLTDWNIEKKLQGRTDISLNETGRKMAEEAGKLYKDVPFDICYSSPLLRARETAEILFSDRDVPIVYDDRLREMSFVIYEGIKVSFKDTNSPLYSLFKDPESYKGAAEGESFDDLFDRTGSFIKEIIEPAIEADKNVIIVGHGALNCSIICQMQNIPLKNFWSAGIENCKLKQII